MLYVERNRTTAGYQVIEGHPKTAAGRPVALDKRTVQVLRDRRHSETSKHADNRPGRSGSTPGTFSSARRQPLYPGYASGRFRLLVKRADIPPVQLHDLRHGAASLAHDAGADLKTLRDLLGHSSMVVTADTYTSFCPTPNDAAPTPPPTTPAPQSATRAAATDPTPASGTYSG
ncbi:tyrosine-type recombinase/integrase [Verrucosispora sioxanthis]|uniref:tyrosine-type recombinase/integrase n=1 Tax=Verrucosispora sioxanthis TaxID=2499994 RepID=UPI0028163DB0|nr:tyrosine-type recombinase/integrase [Verrucosispora sioxanthis]